jgi:diketogulonate reductase-like aldo/keto reductase
MKVNLNSKITLNNGVEIPVIGFGVFRIPDGVEVEGAVKTALDAGYRLIDTAMIYKNEEGTGKAIRESGIAREEIFVTTKLWNTDQGYDSALSAIDASLARLGMSYVDLYLVHWPSASEDMLPDGTTFVSLDKRKDTWRAMEEILRSGKARAIGVSNYMRNHLEEMSAYATVMPMVNQIELHPYLYKRDLLEYCKEHNIVVEAHSPLAPVADVKSTGHDAIDAIATKYGKSSSQVLIRWSLQHGLIPLPKSIRPERIIENIEVFDFEIDATDMDVLDSMNIDLHVRRDPSGLQ